MNAFKERLEEETRQVRFMIEKIKERLAELKPGYLLKRTRKRSSVYYEANENREAISGKMKEADKRVQEIKRYRFLAEQLAALEKDAQVLSYMKRHLRGYGFDDINERLPAAYKYDKATDLEEEQLGQERSTASDSSELGYAFPITSGHIALNGCFVRSVAETTIYNMLLYYGVKFQYERRLRLKDDQGNPCVAYPDFTIRNPQGKTLYWEHVGMYSKEDYRLKFEEKLKLYYQNGIVPGSNLILTFSKVNAALDTEEIAKIIKGQILG